VSIHGAKQRGIRQRKVQSEGILVDGLTNGNSRIVVVVVVVVVVILHRVKILCLLLEWLTCVIRNFVLAGHDGD
jgi:hypothetical protein